MSGSQQALLMGGGKTVNFNITHIQGLSIAPTTCVASVSFNPDGSISYAGFAPVGVGQPTAWTLPLLAGVGANYWIRMILNSGVAPNSGPLNTLQQLNASRTWQWQAASGQGNRHSEMTVQFFIDAGGANMVFSDSFPVDVESQL